MSKIPSILALACLLVSGGVSAKVCRVTLNGDWNNTGQSWSLPLDLYAAGSAYHACDEIWIKSGRYTAWASVATAFWIKRRTALYGGFVGTEVNRNQRNPTASPTIMSGDFGNDDLDDDGNGINEHPSDSIGTNAGMIIAISNITSAPPSQPTVPASTAAQ